MKSPSNELYLGKVKRTSDDMMSKLYWDTTATVNEIMAAVGVDVATNFFFRQVSPAELRGATCTICGLACKFKNRTEVNSFLMEQDRIARKRYPMRAIVCLDCKAQSIARRDSEDKAKSEARRTRERELRYMPYADYLQTPEWQEARKSALKRAGFKCQTCSSGGNLHVHHRTYARRGCELNSDLIVLCAGCHQLFHDNGKLAENGRAA
jgi:5-methylcytosine-specific restriction endonuclease McrA